VVLAPAPTGSAAHADAAPAAPAPTQDAAAPPAGGGLFGRLEAARIETARVRALAIRSAVQLWQATQGDDRCPSYDQLSRDRIVPPDSDNRDPWGGLYRIECSDTGVVVTSNGPDGEPGTTDDVIGTKDPTP
jgi:hypothetical protein